MLGGGQDAYSSGTKKLSVPMSCAPVALRKVRAMSLYSGSVPVTHCTAMPPGFKTCRSSRKYSTEYRLPDLA